MYTPKWGIPYIFLYEHHVIYFLSTYLIFKKSKFSEETISNMMIRFNVAVII